MRYVRKLQLAASVVAAGLATLAARAQIEPQPKYETCEPGSGPLSEPPSSAGCTDHACDSSACQLGWEWNMDPGECVTTTEQVRCELIRGPKAFYHKYTCVTDNPPDCPSLPNHKCKWQVVAGSATELTLIDCHNI